MVSELYQAKVLMMFLQQLLSVKNKGVFVYNIFAAAIVNNFPDNPVLLKNVVKNFLIDIMMHNWTDVIKLS